MLTDNQLEANRANAQKSTGPVTPKGKERSKLNAQRHGLTGQTSVMPNEDMEAFNLMKAAFVEISNASGPSRPNWRNPTPASNGVSTGPPRSKKASCPWAS